MSARSVYTRPRSPLNLILSLSKDEALGRKYDGIRLHAAL